jgi:hypothetical protein
VGLAVGEDPEGGQQPSVVGQQRAVEVDGPSRGHAQNVPPQDLWAREGDEEVHGLRAEPFDEGRRVDGRQAHEGHAVAPGGIGDRVAPGERDDPPGQPEDAVRREVRDLKRERPRAHQSRPKTR